MPLLTSIINFWASVIMHTGILLFPVQGSLQPQKVLCMTILCMETIISICLTHRLLDPCPSILQPYRWKYPYTQDLLTRFYPGASSSFLLFFYPPSLKVFLLFLFYEQVKSCFFLQFLELTVYDTEIFFFICKMYTKSYGELAIHSGWI